MPLSTSEFQEMFGPQSRILRSTDSIPEIVLPSQPGKDDSGGGGGGGGGVGIAAGGNAKTQATPSPATASTAVATAAAPAGTGSQSPSGISSLLSSRSTVPTAVHSSASVLGNKKQPPSSQQIRTNTTLVTESLGPKVERSVSASLIAPANRAKESGPVRSEQRHQGLRAGSVIARVTDQQFALPTAALSGTTHQPSLRDLAKPRPGATSTHGSTIAAMTNTTFTTTKTVPTQRHPQSHPPTITAGSHNTSKQPVGKTPLTLTSVSLPAQSTQAYSTVGATSAISHSSAQSQATSRKNTGSVGSVSSASADLTSRGSRRKDKGYLAYVCGWDNCDFQYEDVDSLTQHVIGTRPGCHFSPDQSCTYEELRCRWLYCVKAHERHRTPNDLMRHLRLQHLPHAAKFIAEDFKSKNFVPVNPLKSDVSQTAAARTQKHKTTPVQQKQQARALKQQAAVPMREATTPAAKNTSLQEARVPVPLSATAASTPPTRLTSTDKSERFVSLVDYRDTTGEISDSGGKGRVTVVPIDYNHGQQLTSASPYILSQTLSQDHSRDLSTPAKTQQNIHASSSSKDNLSSSAVAVLSGLDPSQQSSSVLASSALKHQLDQARMTQTTTNVTPAAATKGNVQGPSPPAGSNLPLAAPLWQQGMAIASTEGVNLLPEEGSDSDGISNLPLESPVNDADLLGDYDADLLGDYADSSDQAGSEDSSCLSNTLVSSHGVVGCRIADEDCMRTPKLGQILVEHSYNEVRLDQLLPAAAEEAGQYQGATPATHAPLLEEEQSEREAHTLEHKQQESQTEAGAPPKLQSKPSSKKQPQQPKTQEQHKKPAGKKWTPKKKPSGTASSPFKMVTLLPGLDVPEESIVDTTGTCKRYRCVICPAYKYMSQMKRRDAPVPILTTSGEVRIAFCTMRCRSRFCVQHADLPYGGKIHPLQRISVQQRSAIEKELSEYDPGMTSAQTSMSDEGSPLLQPYHVTSAPTAAGTKKFDWVSYLQETNSVAAPEYCFLERHLPQRNMFDVDMKVELACDITQSPSNAYLMTVTQVMGMRAKLSYDGCPDAPCEVRSIDSTDIFPLGWCSAQGGQIVAHPDCPTSISQNWAEFLEKTLAKAVGVPDGYFPMKPSRSVPEYLPGHKLEISLAEDGQTRYCVATVAEVLSTSVIIHLDGYEDDSTHYHSLPRDTTQLHPVGYCNERDLKLCPPKDGVPGGMSFVTGVTDEVFDWDSYLQFTGAVAAPRDLFRTTNNLFLPGMKLEAVDNRNPHMICVATVAEVQDDTIKVHFDGWSEKFDLVVKKDDENVFPVGWCAKYGHAVQPPLERGALGKHVRSLSADATPLTPTSYNLGGKRRKRSEAGAGASAGEPLSKRRLSTPAAPKGATPRAVFNIECDHGPFLDPRKVKALPHEVSGSSVAVVLQRTLQHLINASLDRRSVFDLVRPGHSTAIVQCVLPNGERLLKHLQIVDRNNILWGIIKGMLNKLQCCERFITARNVQGQCVRCTTADEIGLSATSSGGHPGQAGAYDAASVSGTPVEQHYSLDGPWLSANGSAHSVSKREADGISPLPQTYNPNRPVVTSSAGGSVLLNSHSSMGSDAGLFNNPKIEHLANKNPKTWTVDDVKSYFENSECSSHVSTLVDQEIDGNAMLLLTPDTLVRFMGLRLGPSLKICGRVDGLKTKWGIH
ncbi:uncharacterized protein LOC135806284 isoform X2 [Sycon ciliatum]|uniref:uncharacterized protein LOC135806284 isoform X2 n=1 Tax=Sycon ciliatum TaxID=27933 RepID=UPI0031F6DA78